MVMRDLKNGFGLKKEKVDCRENRLVFTKDWKFLYWTVWTLDVITIGRYNQLSEAKLYPQQYVNKSITALFKIFGIYCLYRKLSIRAAY